MTDETAAWITERLPAGRDLNADELTDLAAALGRERRLWKHLVRHEPDERVFVELYRDARVDVWLICWLNHQDTGFHDHDLSSGAVFVSDGTLAENRLETTADGLRESITARDAGTVFHFDAARIHRMHHAGGGPATSIHVYSPALWRMGHYAFDEGGHLERQSITYADEMWSGRAEELGSGFLP